MGETYENAAQIQSMIGERNGHLQQGELQPAVLSTYRESENNTEENRYSQVIKSPVNIEENRYSQVIKSPTELPPKNVDPVPKSHTQGEGTKVKLYFKDLGTPPGVVMIINTVLLFLSWCILTGWKSLDKVNLQWSVLYDEIHFFLSATVLPFFISIIIFFLIVCGVNKKMERGKWVLALMMHCMLWSIILMISSIVLAAKVADKRCYQLECHTLNASYAFGFLASIGLGVQAVFHLFELIKSNPMIEIECC